MALDAWPLSKSIRKIGCGAALRKALTHVAKSLICSGKLHTIANTPDSIGPDEWCKSGEI